ncbi:MAG: pyridoxal-phosphate dependent enzyme, partial [Peptostreptococcaceae bacterium]|nr:pyridoxal-phosphate dependent enzyme [Peptostreptococcaceae bacterium]
MVKSISIIEGKLSKKCLPDFLAVEATAPARAFHRELPEYSETPLANLKNLAKILGVKGIYVKDESKRFGLNAFKALGASYAISKIAAKEKNPSKAVYVTATDGNHGRGVAWAAMKLGARAEVFMPVGSKECRADAIRGIGDSKVEITDMNYDDAVRFASDYAKKNGYHFVQDTGNANYRDIPNDITQGYTTMAFEAIKQLEGYGVDKPTHMFLQAGVGSMAGGVLGFIAHYYDGNPPVTTVAEPWEVACIYESIKSGCEGPTSVGG